MKTIRYIIFWAGLMLAVSAASGNSPGGVEITKKNITQKDGKCTVELELNMTGLDVGHGQSVKLTPYLRGDGQSREMPPILVSGKRRYKAYQRSVALGGTTGYRKIYSMADANDDGLLVKTYSATVPYEPWMDAADVVVESEHCDCGMENLTAKKEEPAPPAPPAPKPENPQPQLPELSIIYIVPEDELEKVRDKSIEAFLSYPVGQSVVIPEFKNNPEELRQLYIAINKVNNDDNLKIKSIHIAGFTSPEGTYQSNMALSEKRAKSLKDIIMSRYNHPESMIEAEGMSEDWVYLTELIAESDLGSREKVLEIIRTVGIFEGREQQLMMLNEGNVYREMARRFFPLLRRSVFTMEYYVESFSVEESREIFKKSPEQLSLNEIHQLAHAYPKGSNEFRNIFMTAVKLFPDNAVANINAGAVALEKRDLAAAEKHLTPFADDPRAWNNLGVLYMLRKDPAKAAEYIMKAPACPETEQNRKLILEMTGAGQQEVSAI